MFDEKMRVLIVDSGSSQLRQLIEILKSVNIEILTDPSEHHETVDIADTISSYSIPDLIEPSCTDDYYERRGKGEKRRNRADRWR